MFGNSAPAKDDPGRMETVIGPQTLVTGSVVSRAAVRVDGKVEGEVICEGDVMVGDQGLVKGNIRGRRVIVSGQTVGNIKAEEKAELLANGAVEGDIATACLVIAGGARFQGHCEMTAAATAPVPVNGPGKEKTAKTTGRTE